MKVVFRFFLWVGLFCLTLSGEDFVLSNPSGLLKPKSVEFIQKLSAELKEKTGFALYVVALDQIDGNTKADRDKVKHSLLGGLKEPYGAIFFFQDHRKIDIVLEPHIQGIDSGVIISRYMVPILIADKELNPSNISASILNGYAQLADEIASFYQVSLEQNLIVDKSGAQDYVHYLIYVLLGITFLVVAFVYFARKKV